MQMETMETYIPNVSTLEIAVQNMCTRTYEQIKMWHAYTISKIIQSWTEKQFKRQSKYLKFDQIRFRSVNSKNLETHFIFVFSH